jgi:hypothetical protein
LIRALRIFACSSLLSLAAGGCSVTHDVGQNTTPVRRVYARPTHGELSVSPLVDHRAADADNRALLRAGDELEVGGETQCVNGERNYRGNQVPSQVTRFLTRRIRERGAFKDVKVSGAGRYVLSGTLAAFYGRQEISGTARAGMAFGLIGVLVTAGATTDGRVRVTLRDLVLEDRITSRRVPLADIEITRQGKMSASASCMVIYQHVDEALSDAATRLAEAVERAFAGAVPASAEERAAEQAVRAAEQAARAEAERERMARYEAEHRSWEARMQERAPARRDLLIASIATAVGGAAALTTGILLKNSAADADDQIQDAYAAWVNTTDGAARAMRQDEIRAQESDRDRDDLLGNVFAITGGAALVTSVVLMAIRPSALEEPSSATLSVGADLHGASAWLRLSGEL